MLVSVNSKSKVIPFYFTSNNNLKKNDNKINNPSYNYENYSLNGIPKSYITFKQDKKELEYTEEAQILLDYSKEIAKEYHHKEVHPQHILQAAILQTLGNIKAFGSKLLNSGTIEAISPLNKIANDTSSTNMIENSKKRNLFKILLNELDLNNENALRNLESDKNFQGEPEISENLESHLKDLAKNKITINDYMLVGTAMNTITDSGLSYVSDFLKSLQTLAAFKNLDDIKKSYINIYDNKAIDVWNKLALGSNMFVNYNDIKEVDRLIASLSKTINQPKYGNFNDKNTAIYVMSDNIKTDTMLNSINELKENLPEYKKVVIANMENIVATSLENKEDETSILNNIANIIESTDENLKILLFQTKSNYYKLKGDPVFSNIYDNMTTYTIPQIQTYEVKNMLTRKLLQEVEKPFTKEAKDRAIYHAANIKGVFPDKAIDLMKRISEYYGDSKSKITSKDVDTFAQIGYELFNNSSSNITYDTGKNLNSLYGKETTKKDIEAIIKQIKTGKIGTRGIIISSKDNEAGSGRKYTAETIAGEARVPFATIDAAEFATAERDSDGAVIDTPKTQMNQIFTEAKNAARQNQYKTAIIYINNFEELAFSNPYLPGYKQAMSQLTKEMQNAIQEDVSIIVIGSTNEEYAQYIPTYVRGFNQSILVDSPAFNKRARKEVLIHKINDVGLTLAYKNSADKEHLLNKLVKLSEYMTFVEIKSLIDKTIQIMYERNKQKASIGEFIEAYLQLQTGRTSRPEMPEFNKQATTSHECGHATNLEVMNEILRKKGQPWHQSREVNFITLDPRGNFLGAVFEGKADNTEYPFEALFSELVCSYGGYSTEKLFFNMDGSSGIAQDLAQATELAKRGVEYFGFGFNTGKISNYAKIQSATFYEKVYKDIDVILNNAKIASDLITDTYRKFNEYFTKKYSKLIGTDDCMVDGDDFRKLLRNWEKSLSLSKKEDINVMEEIIMDIIESSKKGIKYGKIKI